MPLPFISFMQNSYTAQSSMGWSCSGNEPAGQWYEEYAPLTANTNPVWPGWDEQRTLLRPPCQLLSTFNINIFSQSQAKTENSTGFEFLLFNHEDQNVASEPVVHNVLMCNLKEVVKYFGEMYFTFQGIQLLFVCSSWSTSLFIQM